MDKNPKYDPEKTAFVSGFEDTYESVKVTSGTQKETTEREIISTTWTKGEIQIAQYRDLGFSVIFLLHLATLFGMTIAFGPRAFQTDLESAEEDSHEENEDDMDFSPDIIVVPYSLYASVAVISLVAALVQTCAIFFLMDRVATDMIQFSLRMNVGMFSLLTILSIVSGNILLSIFFFASTCFIACYYKMVQHRVAFVAANLRTTTYAICSNSGIWLYAILEGIGMLGFVILWLIVFTGYNSYHATNCHETSSGDYVCNDGAAAGVAYVFLLISLFWTIQVIQNVLYVTISGIIGTWWFYPREASSFCSPAVRDSFTRSVTYSFGSICFGSLIVAVVKFLKYLVWQARRNDNSVLNCLMDCLLSYLEDALEYFNRWAYVFVGIYGYSYLDAGKNVMKMFGARGWTTFLTDYLIEKVLSMLTLTVGILTGLVALIPLFFYSEITSGAMIGAFVIGFVVGIMVASVPMKVLNFAADTVFVCFAEAPLEFEQNHPRFSEEMRDAWSSVLPCSAF